MGFSLEIQLIAIMVASACSILGTFLVLKSMAMVSDAITHTILLGIVVAFFAVHDLNSPLLIVGAGIVGVLTVYLVELLNSTRLVKEDSAIGVVFPLLFSIAVILISKYAGNVHLDVDSVLLGELAFAPFNRIEIFGFSVAVHSQETCGFVGRERQFGTTHFETVRRICARYSQPHEVRRENGFPLCRFFIVGTNKQ